MVPPAVGDGGHTAPPAAVIVNWNSGPHLVRCADSLRSEGVEHVVVADNASRDESLVRLEAAHPDVVVVRTGSNLGFGRGANRGAAATPGGVDLLVLNPDVVVRPGAVKALQAVLDARPEVAVVGPRIENPDGSLYPSPRTFPDLAVALGHAALGLVLPRNRFTRRYRLLDLDHERATDADWVSGSCFLVRRAAWDQLGGFDESYFMYAEDVDLCWRAHRAGWRVVFEPAAAVVHEQGVSTGQRPYRMIAEHHRSLWRFARRSTAGWQRVLLPVVGAGMVGRLLAAWVHRAVAGRWSRLRV